MTLSAFVLVAGVALGVLLVATAGVLLWSWWTARRRARVGDAIAALIAAVADEEAAPPAELLALRPRLCAAAIRASARRLEARPMDVSGDEHEHARIRSRLTHHAEACGALQWARTAREDVDQARRQDAVRLLAAVGSPREAAAAHDDPAPQVRAAAVRAMGSLEPDEDLVSWLRPALVDDDVIVRASARFALSRWGRPAIQRAVGDRATRQLLALTAGGLAPAAHVDVTRR